jgi:hypothetical protein
MNAAVLQKYRDDIARADAPLREPAGGQLDAFKQSGISDALVLVDDGETVRRSQGMKSDEAR